MSGEVMKVAVFGLGYVGTVTAACLASQGHDVWGVDVDAAKVDEVRAGRSPVAEPGLDDAHRAGGGGRHAARHDLVPGRPAPGRGVARLRRHPSAAGGATELSYIRRSVD